MKLQETWQYIETLFMNNFIQPWIYEVFALIVVVLLAGYIVRSVFNKLERKAALTTNPWDDALINSVRRPLRYTITGLGILYAAEIAGSHTDALIFNSIGAIREVLVISMLSWSMISFVKHYEDAVIRLKSENGESFDRTTIHAMAKLLRTAILITTALVMLQTLGFSVSGVLAFGGIGGIAIGFAAKDLLANFFGGLMIYLDRPFCVGDWIRSSDKEIEGVVEVIGWRLTTIRTFDMRPLYVPNSVFANIAVENPSRMSHRRIYETIGLRYDDVKQVEAVVTDVRAMLQSHAEIDTTKTLIVNFNQFNESSLDFFVYTFTKTTDWTIFHAVKQDVLLQIASIVEHHGAEMAYPTRTMIISEGNLASQADR